MKEHRFRASTVREALVRTRQELGNQALVMSTEQIKDGFEVVARTNHQKWVRENPFLSDGTQARGAQENASREHARCGLPAKWFRGLSGDGEESLRAALERHVPMYPRSGCLDEHGVRRRRVFVFVGPTGVGKTTTLAKLAGRLVQDANVRPGLITLDTYRVAAVQQLQAYADLLRVPLGVASTREDFHEELQRFEDRDVVLVDTTGRSPFDDERLNSISELLGGSDRVETFLVLSATTSPGSATAALERFRCLSIDAAIVTKLDEVENAGAVLATLSDASLPLAYVTDGQDVPMHLHPAEAATLAERLPEAEQVA